MEPIKLDSEQRRRVWNLVQSLMRSTERLVELKYTSPQALRMGKEEAIAEERARKDDYFDELFGLLCKECDMGYFGGEDGKPHLCVITQTPDCAYLAAWDEKQPDGGVKPRLTSGVNIFPTRERAEADIAFWRGKKEGSK